MSKNPMNFMVCVGIPEARKFYASLKKKADDCCGCGRSIGQDDDWSSLAQVQKDGTIVGGAICKVCHRSFGRWLRERRLAGRRRERSRASRGGKVKAVRHSPSGGPEGGTSD